MNPEHQRMIRELERAGYVVTEHGPLERALDSATLLEVCNLLVKYVHQDPDEPGARAHAKTLYWLFGQFLQANECLFEWLGAFRRMAFLLDLDKRRHPYKLIYMWGCEIYGREMRHMPWTQ